jgi:HSP20 family protein
MKIAVMVRQLDLGHILWCGRVVWVERAHRVRVVRGVQKMPDVGNGVIGFDHANGMLTIRGEKRTERDEQDKDKNWYVVERSYGSFSRTIPLPFDPDPAKVEAKFDKGVLHIRLPKPAEVAQKQQKIEIKKG